MVPQCSIFCLHMFRPILRWTRTNWPNWKWPNSFLLQRKRGKTIGKKCWQIWPTKRWKGRKWQCQHSASNLATKLTFTISIDPSVHFQTILGFGGAFSDAVGLNLNALSGSTREKLLRAYFDPERGIGYSLGRVPIASTDFSTREYSYLDQERDFDLETFKLAPEDLEAKARDKLDNFWAFPFISAYLVSNSIKNEGN